MAGEIIGSDAQFNENVDILGKVNLFDSVNHGEKYILKIKDDEKLRIGELGQVGIAGTDFGIKGQVLKSTGPNSSVIWSDSDVTSVEDYGAVGDGITDDTKSIQNALDKASGRRVYLSRGTYMVSETIEIPSNSHIFGDGESTVIKMISTVGRDTTLMRTGKRGNKRENIIIRDMTLDFNRDRWTVSGGETLKDTEFSGGDQDNDQTTLSICFSEYVLVKNVRCLDGYKHCIDITSPRYPDNNNGTTYDNDSSRYVTIENCFASGAGDDNITTHFSSNILITGCRSITPSGVRTGNNSNCFEIDDGSRNVTMTDNVAIKGNKGLQIKGHTYAPAPYNVTVDGLRVINCARGIDAKHLGFLNDNSTGDKGLSPNAKNIKLSNIEVLSPREFVATDADNVGIATYNASYGIRVSSYDTVHMTNITVSDSSFDMANDFEPSTGFAENDNGVIRLMQGLRNIVMKNISINGFGNVGVASTAIHGLYGSDSLLGPFILDGFTSIDGPKYPIRFSQTSSTYRGVIQNYAIRTETEGYGIDGAGVYVTSPNVQVGAGIATGYAYPVRGGVGSNDNAQPVGMTLQTNMRSTSNTATTPKTIINLDMYEDIGDQNLGAGEGLKIAWRQRIQQSGLDAIPLDVGYLAFQKQNATDVSDRYDFIVGSGIGTETFKVRSDGSATFTGELPPAINNAAGNTSAVFATSYVNFYGKGSANPKTIRDSLNISSVGDLAEGEYRVNFTTNYPNNDYTVCATSGENDGDNHNCSVSVRFMAVDRFDLYVENVDDGFEDRDFIMAAVFITP